MLIVVDSSHELVYPNIGLVYRVEVCVGATFAVIRYHVRAMVFLALKRGVVKSVRALERGSSIRRKKGGCARRSSVEVCDNNRNNNDNPTTPISLNLAAR